MSRLTFITHSGAKREPVEGRAAVKSHISRRNRYLQRKKQAQELVLRSQQFAQTCPSRSALEPKDDSSEPQHALRDEVLEEVLDSGPSTPDHGLAEEVSPGFANSVIGHHPDTLLKHGNSDPFNAFNIKIDATVIGLLQFAASCLIPSNSNRGGDSIPFRAGMPTHLTFMTVTPTILNQDLCNGYAYLARYAALVSSVSSASQHMTDVATKYRICSSAHLRNRISVYDSTTFTGDPSTDDARRRMKKRICWTIHVLAAAELDAGNLSEAITYGKMLRNLLQPADPADRVVLQPLQLLSIFYNNMKRASVTLTRPSFDLDRWESENCKMSWTDLLHPQSQLPVFNLRPGFKSD